MCHVRPLGCLDEESVAVNMSKEAEIDAFVRRFVKSVGGKLDLGKDRTLHAELPTDIARLLESDRRLRLAFERNEGAPPASSQEEAPQFVTFGHPLLDRMLSIAKERGRAANLLFTFSMEPDFVERVIGIDPFRSPSADDSLSALLQGPLAELVRQARSVRVANARLRIMERKITHQRQLLLFFKVSMLSDDKWETTLPLLIDPVTEQVDRPVDLSGAVSFIPHRQAQSTGRGGQETYTVDRLYRKACIHLETRLAAKMREFERKAAERAREETRRIEEYYQGLAAESLEPLRNLFRRISQVGMRADMARSWQTQSRYQDQVDALKEEARSLESVYRHEREALDREKAQRLLEVDERYRPRAEIALTHAAYVMVPRVEWRLRVVGENVTREATLLYDLLRRVFVDWSCESCERPLLRGPAHLCSCEALVCEACFSSCASCSESTCSVCREERCHLCGKTTCSRCDTVCPLGEAFVDMELPSVCQSCRTEWCRTCLAGSLLHTEHLLGELGASVI